MPTAIAHPNIAFIKYWGNLDDSLRLPLNSSISMGLSGLETSTSVTVMDDLLSDDFTLNGEVQIGLGFERVSNFLNQVRELAGVKTHALVKSANNFPLGAGIASSASAFAALALAASAAYELNLNEKELSTLARLGSGSAARSIPSGFVEWVTADNHEASYACSLAPAEHWALVDLIAIVNASEKKTGSTQGHYLAKTSPLNELRQQSVAKRFTVCRNAILARDFAPFAEAVEADSEWMHAVMRTSKPPLLYWQPATELLLWHVKAWRDLGHAVCATVDAGPNVHLIAEETELDWLNKQLSDFPGVKSVLIARPAEGARLVQDQS